MIPLVHRSTLGKGDPPMQSQEATGDQGSLIDRRSIQSPDPPSPGHQSLYQEETASEFRRLREEMRQIQLGQPGVPTPRGGGESYKLPTPTKYSPEGHKSPTEFLFMCEQYFEACGISEERQVPIASTFLATGAILWWRQHKTSWPLMPPQDRIRTWPQFKAALQRMFTPITEKEVSRDKLHALKQLGSVQTYTAMFRQLTFDIDDIGEAEKLSCYRRGLKHAIRVQLALREPNTLEEAMAAAERVDVALNVGSTNRTGAYREWDRSSNRRSLNAIDLDTGEVEGEDWESTPDDEGSIGDRDEQVAKLLELAALISKDRGRGTPRPSSRRPPGLREAPSIRCYECNQMGHYQKDCPLKGQNQ